MRNLYLLDQYRAWAWERRMGGPGDDRGGAFIVPSEVDRRPLRIVASNGEGWDHVSVSRADRCPTWAEMEQVKRLFFAEGETAMQLHVPSSDHVNNHPYCLHLWRPHDAPIPRPPALMVGVAHLTPEHLARMSSAEIRALRESVA
jgi:hypothetical protein